MPSSLMELKILQPTKVFASAKGVIRIVAETLEGSFGLLPHRRDCVAALVAGILTYETESDGETFVAVDEGILVKTGTSVLISVRRALAGKDLSQLRQSIQTEFLNLTDQETELRSMARRMESGLLSRLAEFYKPEMKNSGGGGLT